MKSKTEKISLAVMAPLLLGDAKRPKSAESQRAFSKFRFQLDELKGLGAQALSTDIWWGLIQPSEQSFDFAYYELMAKYIKEAGLYWKSILSFHECGGNVGDDCQVKLPDWVFPKLKALNNGDERGLKFVSEQNNASPEYVSVWASDLILPDLKRVMLEFQRQFASYAEDIAELNISLGPSGELRYPSYNSHDSSVDYPTRGALQAYSALARASFKDFVLKRYPGESELNKAWGKPLDPGGHVIEPPRDAASFFQSGSYFASQYGRDFFDWYSQSLQAHGRKLMRAAMECFQSENAPFARVALGAKIPGVHWRMGSWNSGRIEFADRGAELASGLIASDKSSWGFEKALGYEPLLKLFQELSAESKSKLVLHFTCMEMPDGGGQANANSLAYSLVSAIGKSCRRLSLPVMGENALSFHLYDKACWDRMRSHLAFSGSEGQYRGLTLLRMGELLESGLARHELRLLASQLEQQNQAA